MTAIRHCEERLDFKQTSMQFGLNLKVTSDAAISLHYLTDESFFNDYKITLIVVRARRLLRGCSNDGLSKGLAHTRLNLAMTSVVTV
jgi:hypothetical protein